MNDRAMSNRIFRTITFVGVTGLFLLAGGMVPVRAQDTTQAVVPAGEPVVFRGDTLFRLYGTVGPFTPEERATALAERLDSLANDPLARASSVEVVDTSGAIDIRVAGFILMTVTDRDAAEAGLTRTVLGEQYATQIQATMQSREGAATLQSLLIGAGLTLLATLALVLLFKLLNRVFPTLYRLLESWRDTKIPSVRIQRLELLSSARLTDFFIGIAKVLRVAAVVVALYIFAPLVLSFFPWTRRLSTRLVDYVVNPLDQGFDAFIAYLPNLFTIAVIVVVIWYVLKFIHLFFNGIEHRAIALPGFYPEWAQPTYKIVRFVVIIAAAIVIFPYLPGSDTPAFRGISVVMGLLISFGSASAIANVVAGVVMTYMRPFELGDRVKIAETVGDVVEKTLLITRVRTTKKVDITIPNAMVLSSHIINYSSTADDGGMILHTSVTIGYDVPWRQVHEVLLSAVENTEGIMPEPKPFVLQTSLDDFYVAYELNVYTEQPNQMAKIYSDLHQNIQDRCNEAGIEILSPHYGAMRDGNQKAVPEQYLPKSYTAPVFGVRFSGSSASVPTSGA